MYILQVMIICYCGLLAGFLLRRPHQLQQSLLAAFLLTVSVIIAINHSVEAGWLSTKPLLRELLPLLLGPLFFGFVKALVFSHWRLRLNHAMHLTPVLLWLPLRPELPIDWRQPCLLSATFFLFSLYLVQAWRLTRYRQQQIYAQVSISQSTSLHWVQRTIAGFLLMVLLEATELLLARSGIFVSQTLYLADMLLLTLLFAGLVWEALRQPDFLLTLPMAEPPPTLLSKSAAVTEASPEVPDPAQLETLHQFILQSQIYQQANLSLQQLASAMDLPPRHISQMINQGFSRNFSDFINGYRVRAAAEALLTKTPPENMLTLLHQVGFNSKSTFNLMFKREFGCTPSQYRQLHSKQIEK
ncbi:MAG: helix-turn-helix domain-containing protein [Rheinheimera sp.]|nr:helix-turn-helix domain-containing protein [Rheinheimera sp.]